MTSLKNLEENIKKYLYEPPPTILEAIENEKNPNLTTQQDLKDSK